VHTLITAFDNGQSEQIKSMLSDVQMQDLMFIRGRPEQLVEVDQFNVNTNTFETKVVNASSLNILQLAIILAE